jgi:hypothetical protein
MAINQHWPRWVFASFSKWFFDLRQGITFSVEGEDQKTEAAENYFEFRMNGPICTEKASGDWKIEAVVNILVVSKQNVTNIHTLHANVGIAAAAFTKCIPMKKYGSDTSGVDDQSQFGVMQLTTYEGEAVKITHIGQVNPDVKAMQSMVQGYYCMRLEV